MRPGRRVTWLLTLVFPLIGCSLRAQCPDGKPPPCGGARPASPLVAVLLFENRSRDSADAYLSSGLAEELTRLLQRTPGLRVASRFQTQRFGTGAGSDPEAVARALGATYLVTGSVLRDGRDMRVGVELTRAPSFAGLWSDRFDRRADALLELLDDIAAAIAREILGRIQPSAVRQAASGTSVSAEAHDLFLRGNYDLERRETVRAIGKYERAIALAPWFGRAHARYAYAHANLLDAPATYDDLPPESLLARGLRSVARARRLAPDESDTWMADGYLRLFQYPRSFEGATTSFERAIRLDSTNAEAHHQYAWTLLLLGRDSAAQAEYRRALAIDPERVVTMLGLARVHHVGARWPDAIAWYDSVLIHQRASPTVAAFKLRALQSQGDLAAVRAWADTLEALMRTAGQPMPPSLLAARFLATGDTSAAREVLIPAVDRLLADTTWAPIPIIASGLAAILVAADLQDRALDVLERSSRRGLRTWVFLRYPDLAPLRASPRFQRLVAESRGALP